MAGAHADADADVEDASPERSTGGRGEHDAEQAEDADGHHGQEVRPLVGAGGGEDGGEEAAVMASEQAAERKALLAAQRDEMTARARRLERAAAVLTHMLDCHRDRPLDCPVTHAHIHARVDAALAGEELADAFLPPATGTATGIGQPSTAGVGPSGRTVML
ncbi:hypothetical protein [Kitasatospora sp. NPDC088779]|uniref:hypothetical protein n=1 Tax=Kitasatospora sp. NPDC088779 TaxID=3154964 RepID=UPI00341E95BF